jgi:hypothetical protein
LSKQRNKHLQTKLIEAAKMAPRYSSALAMLYGKSGRAFGRGEKFRVDLLHDALQDTGSARSPPGSQHRAVESGDGGALQLNW